MKHTNLPQLWQGTSTQLYPPKLARENVFFFSNTDPEINYGKVYNTPEWTGKSKIIVHIDCSYFFFISLQQIIPSLRRLCERPHGLHISDEGWGIAFFFPIGDI